MKKIFLIILSIHISVALPARDQDSAMLRAERFYRQNEFSKAIAAYQSLADSGWTSPVLFYNLGNACFKNHDIKSAILYYERAKRLAPNDEAIDFNLNLSRSLTFDKVEAVPELFLITWGKAIRDRMTVRGWSWWSIGSFIAMLALGLLFLFVHRMRVRRISFGLAVFCFLLSLVSFTFGYLQKANVLRTDEAIVFAPSVTLKSSPDDSGNNLFILHEGIKVRIEDRIGEWCEVRIADGNKGWMRISELEII
ncbi:MAG: tetratricopeptide repeat protein [Bacteroidales bacterium]|jgi:tetratricopeptide (TPR) repeat protein|nr:tetratricopeptide repeat protein [Bacteroidales bacterium]